MYSSWKEFLIHQQNQLYFETLMSYLKNEYASQTIYPPQHQLFEAFRLTPLDQVKVVILGQDPYHGPNQAHGLSFSVQKGQTIPPSLRNMYVELASDLGIKMPKHGCLDSWAKQGVLLLNAVLTVRQSEANSHKDQGWEQFTDAAIEAVNALDRPIVFVLWGAYAQKKINLIDQSKHHVIQSPHPSPFSAHKGFLGSRPYSKINAFLNQTNQYPIDWSIKS